MDHSGWRPLQRPARGSTVDLAPTPFARLARVHALAAVGDGFIAVALAGSIFFSIDPSAARWRVALYLLLTIAPFAVVTPLIGPAIDRARGGRRTMILASTSSRMVVAFLMVGQMDSFLLFPLAFTLLILQKTYSVAKSAMVPKLVDSDRQLVEANSKLSLLSSIAGMSGAALGALLTVIGGPSWSGSIAVLAYLAAAVATLSVPRVQIAELPAPALERLELRGGGIILAASAMGVMRGIVGFLTFLLAFEFRGGREGVDIKPQGSAAGATTAISRNIDIVGDPGSPTWYFGAVLAAAGIGALVGARFAPELRRRIPEERILLGVLGVVTLAGAVAVWRGGLSGAVLVSLAVGMSAAMGKLAFDSLVQRDAPDVNYGRSFARFEARFQLLWVIGAFVPVVLPIPARLGFVLVGGAAAFAGASYLAGTKRLAAVEAGPPPRGVEPGAPAADPDEGDPAAAEPRDGEARADDTRVMWSAEQTTVFVAPPPPTEPSPVVVPEAVWGEIPVTPLVSSAEGIEVDPDPSAPEP
jgi:hypothetical protein